MDWLRAFVTTSHALSYLLTISVEPSWEFGIVTVVVTSG